MLKRTVSSGGAHLAPMLLRRGVCLHPLSRFTRSFSQNATAVEDPAVDAVAEKNLSREVRVSRMESFARRHLKEAGSLPSSYILVKEFGGAKTTATKVLSRLEEEFKNQPAADGKIEATSVEKKLSEASSGEKKPSVGEEKFKPATATATEGSLQATGGSIAGSQAKQVDNKPPVSLWQKLHSLTYGEPPAAQPSSLPTAQPSSLPTAQPSSPPTAQATKPTSRPIPPFRMKALLSESSEEESDSEPDSESESVNFPQPESNPAQPLFRTDLQPRHGLYIKFLSPQATESDVRGAFRSCGEICRVQVVRGRNPAAKYIYAFVDFTTEAALREALKKEVMIRGLKVTTETANSQMRTKEKPAQKQESDSESDAEAPKTKALKAPAAKPEPEVVAAHSLHRTVVLESIPLASLPQIVEALSKYGEVVSSRTKQNPSGNTSAYIEFKKECDKDNALAASKVLLGGKALRMIRIDSPATTVVRLSNIPAGAHEKIVSMYRSYGHVDKVEARMEGILDIYYSKSEIKNMSRILDKLNALHVNKTKLRAVPAPISYPKTVAETAETPAGLKWIAAQREEVTKNLESCLKKAAMHSQDLQELLKLQHGGVKSIASN